ncbi:hypothetical protein KKH86_01430, partial [Patescibacteria group bacterium]|nr:hypothetical protein [Patescibacteria group bacterium]
DIEKPKFETKEQINIGKIKEIIEVEVLPGCHKEPLIKKMREIANEKGKTVKAKFQDEEIVVEPEDQKE